MEVWSYCLGGLGPRIEVALRRHRSSRSQRAVSRRAISRPGLSSYAFASVVAAVFVSAVMAMNTVWVKGGLRIAIACIDGTEVTRADTTRPSVMAGGVVGKRRRKRKQKRRNHFLKEADGALAHHPICMKASQLMARLSGRRGPMVCLYVRQYMDGDIYKLINVLCMLPGRYTLFEGRHGSPERHVLMLLLPSCSNYRAVREILSLCCMLPFPPSRLNVSRSPTYSTSSRPSSL